MCGSPTSNGWSAISTVSASPTSTARRSSPRAKAVRTATTSAITDALNPELGGDEDFRTLSATLRARRMGLIVDFVPNHMGADPNANRWWRDVLENGPSSPYARFFDIDWRPAKPELRDKVLLPILGGPYGDVLARGELQLEFVDDAFVVRYFERTLPIDSQTTAAGAAATSAREQRPIRQPHRTTSTN